LGFDGNQNKHLGTQKITARGKIHNLIYSWKVKKVFGTCPVETGAVDAHRKLPSSLGDNNKIVLEFNDFALKYRSLMEP
jgi:hypothetical protein